MACSVATVAVACLALGNDDTESNKKLVVNSTSIVEEGTNNFLDTVLAGIA